MFTVFAILVAVHGLIHVLGAAKAFHWAELPELAQPISPLFGLLWLLAALLFLATSVVLVSGLRWWWAVGIAGVIVSTIAIVPSWADAKFGMVANIAVLIGVSFGFLIAGPFSVRAADDREIGTSVQVPHPPRR